jgi:SAM-dependent methyltransferase
MHDTSYLHAVRAAYDAIAVDYAERFRTELEAKPLGRAMLAAFAELVLSDGGGPVADVGCGPGRVTAHLRALGVDAFGVDLSPAMVAVARRAHPGLRFVEGSLTALGLAGGALRGVVAWYSIIHLPPERVPAAFREIRRVLAPGGRLLLAFQVGDDTGRVSSAFGKNVAVEFHRWPPDRVAALLEDAGFVVDAQLVRRPDETERSAQAHILARTGP